MFTKLAAGIALLFTAAVPVSAEQVIGTLRINYPYIVQVEFYSQYGNAAWRNDRAFDLTTITIINIASTASVARRSAMAPR